MAERLNPLGHRYDGAKQQTIASSLGSITEYIAAASKWSREGRYAHSDPIFHINLNLIGAGFEIINLLDRVFHPKDNPMDPDALNSVNEKLQLVIRQLQGIDASDTLLKKRLININKDLLGELQSRLVFLNNLLRGIY